MAAFPVVRYKLLCMAISLPLFCHVAYCTALHVPLIFRTQHISVYIIFPDSPCHWWKDKRSETRDAFIYVK